MKPPYTGTGLLENIGPALWQATTDDGETITSHSLAEIWRWADKQHVLLTKAEEPCEDCVD